MAASAIPDLFGAVDFAQNDGSEAEQENPGQQEQDYGPDNRDLPKELQDALISLLQIVQMQDLFQRRVEVMRDRRNRFYERGIQHIYEDRRSGVFVQGTPGAWVPDPAGGSIQCPNYIEDYNIFARALQIIIAKLTENPPGIDFQPDSGNSAVDDQAAQAAEAYRILYDRRNDVKDILTAIVRMFGVSGRTITWTRTIADKQRWGTDEQGNPRRCQTTTVHGTIEAKVPVMAKTLGDCPYCVISEDPHIFIAKMDHPYFADKISEQGDDGVGDTQFERLARLGALQGNSGVYQTSDSYNYYVERRHVWFRPAMFQEKMLDSSFGEGTLREALMALFPNGCQFTVVGHQYVGSRDACMDDELAVDFPYAGDGMSRMAIMDPAISIVDRFNDDMNAYAEVKDFGWPSTWVNAEESDIAAVNDQIASPYAFRALKSRPPREIQMQHAFWREPDPDIPASFMQHTEYLATQLLQFILAIPSAVQGAGMPDQKTASGYTAALNQALGQLGVIWGAVKRLMSKVYRQAALAASKDDQDQKVLMVPSPKGVQTLQMADLGKGHFLAHPDDDSNFPESTVQKRSTLQMLLELAATQPEIAAQLLQSPDNWDVMARILGMPELTIPEAMVRRKQLAEIELLLQQSPQEATPEEIEQAQIQHATDTMAAQGAPENAPPQEFGPTSVPPKSSITPGPLDFHEWEFEMCREFLSDWPKVQQQIAAGNQAGIDNVFLHAMEHQQYVMAAAQAQAAAQAAAQPQQKPGEPAQQAA